MYIITLFILKTDKDTTKLGPDDIYKFKVSTINFLPYTLYTCMCIQLFAGNCLNNYRHWHFIVPVVLLRSQNEEKQQRGSGQVAKRKRKFGIVRKQKWQWQAFSEVNGSLSRVFNVRRFI